MNWDKRSEFNKQVDFEYAFIQEPVIEGNIIRVVIKDLIIIEHGTKATCQVTFYGVMKSIRRITKYVLKDGEEDLGERMTINDGPFKDIYVNLSSHVIEGVFESYEGWKGYIGWDIQSERYEIAGNSSL